MSEITDVFSVLWCMRIGMVAVICLWLSSAAAQEVDTLRPPSYADPCYQEGFFTYFDNSGQGPVLGNNGYGDLEKAQLLKLPVSGNGLLSDVIIYWGYKRLGDNGSVRCKIYEATVFDAPGSLSGTSNSTFVSAIDTAVSSGGGFNFFSFSSPLSFTDEFFVSVDFSSMESGDTLGILSTEKGCGSGCLIYEKWNDGSWHKVCNVWGIIDLDMIVEAVVDWSPNPASAIEDYAADGELGIRPAFPNPATDFVRLPFYLEKGGEVRIELLNTAALPLGSSQIQQHFGEGEHFVELDVSALAPGLYFYRIQMEGRRLTSKFLKK